MKGMGIGSSIARMDVVRSIDDEKKISCDDDSFDWIRAGFSLGSRGYLVL